MVKSQKSTENTILKCEIFLCLRCKYDRIKRQVAVSRKGKDILHDNYILGGYYIWQDLHYQEIYIMEKVL